MRSQEYIIFEIVKLKKKLSQFVSYLIATNIVYGK